MYHKLVIFFTCFLTRLLFKFFSGYSNYELFQDSFRYDILSNRILTSDGSMDMVAYLIAPLYPYTLALFKSTSPQNWEWISVFFQFLLVSLSAVYIYKIILLLFKSQTQAFIGSLIYILYPLTLWYNFTLVQETTFQAYFIFFLFYILRFFRRPTARDIIISGFFFALAFLTKSHVLLLLPFLAIVFYIHRQTRYGFGFFILLGMASLPHGLKNLTQHGIYTLSSSGSSSLFLLGHSDETYDCMLNRTAIHGRFSSMSCDPTFVFDREYDFPGYGKVNGLSVKERNQSRLDIAIDWIKKNPYKFIELKWYGLKRFIIPGVDWNQYRFGFWLGSFLLGLLIYIPGYLYLYGSLKSDWKLHLLSVSIVLVIASIFLIFFPINRFRVITMEPLLIVYASVFYYTVWQKIRGQLHSGN